MIDKHEKGRAETIASSWRSLNEGIMLLTEEQLDYLLQRERKKRNPRVTILERLHQRLMKLRTERERRELLP